MAAGPNPEVYGEPVYDDLLIDPEVYGEAPLDEVAAPVNVNRVYFPRSTDLAAPISPAYDASWEATGSATRIGLDLAKGATYPFTSAYNTQILTGTKAVNNTAYDVLLAQYVSPPLYGDQTISGAIKGIFQAAESNAAADASPQMVIRVVSNDGSTVRGTLIASDANAIGSDELVASTSAQRNAKYPKAWTGSGQTPTSVNALDGDRIVIEVGVRGREASTTSRTFYLRTGNPTALADLAENQTDQTTSVIGAPWVEFVDTLSFSTSEVARVSQLPVESLVRPDNAAARVSQLPVEALVLPSTASARVSQLPVEVLYIPFPQANAQAATGTGTSFGATVSTTGGGTNAPAEAASGSGTAVDPAGKISAAAQAATGSGSSAQAGGTGSTTAGAATGTGSASDPAVLSGQLAYAEAAAGSGASSQPSGTVATGGPGIASGTGAASNATVTTSGGTSAAAELAAGTGASNGAAASVKAVAQRPSGTAAASNASGSLSNSVLALYAPASGIAFDPTVVAAIPSASPIAGRATGTGTAYGTVPPSGFALVTLVETAHAGDTTITVSSTAGLNVGANIVLDGETVTVAAILSDTTVQLTAPLAMDHSVSFGLGTASAMVASGALWPFGGEPCLLPWASNWGGWWESMADTTDPYSPSWGYVGYPMSSGFDGTSDSGTIHDLGLSNIPNESYVDDPFVWRQFEPNVTPDGTFSFRFRYLGSPPSPGFGTQPYESVQFTVYFTETSNKTGLSAIGNDIAVGIYSGNGSSYGSQDDLWGFVNSYGGGQQYLEYVGRDFSDGNGPLSADIWDGQWRNAKFVLTPQDLYVWVWRDGDPQPAEPSMLVRQSVEPIPQFTRLSSIGFQWYGILKSNPTIDIEIDSIVFDFNACGDVEEGRTVRSGSWGIQQLGQWEVYQGDPVLNAYDRDWGFLIGRWSNLPDGAEGVLWMQSSGSLPNTMRVKLPRDISAVVAEHGYCWIAIRYIVTPGSASLPANSVSINFYIADEDGLAGDNWSKVNLSNWITNATSQMMIAVDDSAAHSDEVYPTDYTAVINNSGGGQLFEGNWLLVKVTPTMLAARAFREDYTDHLWDVRRNAAVLTYHDPSVPTFVFDDWERWQQGAISWASYPWGIATSGYLYAYYTVDWSPSGSDLFKLTTYSGSEYGIGRQDTPDHNFVPVPVATVKALRSLPIELQWDVGGDCAFSIDAGTASDFSDRDDPPQIWVVVSPYGSSSLSFHTAPGPGWPTGIYYYESGYLGGSYFAPGFDGYEEWPSIIPILRIKLRIEEWGVYLKAWHKDVPEPAEWQLLVDVGADMDFYSVPRSGWPNGIMPNLNRLYFDEVSGNTFMTWDNFTISHPNVASRGPRDYLYVEIESAGSGPSWLDSFGRTIAATGTFSTDGWGTASNAGDWHTGGAGPSTMALYVQGSRGILNLSTPGTWAAISTYLDGLDGRLDGDFDLVTWFYITAIPPASTALGTSFWIGSDLDTQPEYDSLNHYVSQALAVHLEWVRDASGVSTVRLGLNTDTSYPTTPIWSGNLGALLAGTEYAIRWQRSGSTIRARFWKVGQTEPTNWALEGTITVDEPTPLYFGAWFARFGTFGVAPQFNLDNIILYNDVSETTILEIDQVHILPGEPLITRGGTPGSVSIG